MLDPWLPSLFQGFSMLVKRSHFAEFSEMADFCGNMQKKISMRIYLICKHINTYCRKTKVYASWGLI